MKYFHLTENKITIYQKLWDIATSVKRYIQHWMPVLEKPKINNLPFHLSKLVKGKWGKRNKAEINDTGKKKTIEKNTKPEAVTLKKKK